MKDRLHLLLFGIGAAAAAWAFWAISGEWGFAILIFIGIINLAVSYTQLLMQQASNDKKSVRWSLLVSAWGSVIAMALIMVDLIMTTSRMHH